jgi:predicted ATPase
MVKEVYNNQTTRLQYLSTGSMKILFLLTCIIRARKEGTQLLFIEELDNSIHPNLMQTLLSIITEMMGNTKLLFTSHSPNVARNLTAKQLYVGLPSDKGVVDFRTIKPSKVKSVLSIASAGDMSLGEYLFELMLDTEADPSLIDFFFNPQNEE